MNVPALLSLLLTVIFLALVALLGVPTPHRLIDVVGLLIVVGGTFTATLMSYPFSELVAAGRLVGTTMRAERLQTQHLIDELVRITRLWSKGDVHAVEAALAGIGNPFLRTGVQMVIDNTPPEYVQDLLNWRVARMREREAAQAQLFRTMASYAPAFGMLGTLLGLVNLMELLGVGEIRAIGSQLAIALLTTFYGVLLANLVFKPLAVRLESRTERRMVVMNMIQEGIAMMGSGCSPTLVSETLKSFVAQVDDEMFDGHRRPTPSRATTGQPGAEGPGTAVPREAFRPPGAPGQSEGPTAGTLRRGPP